MKVFHSKKRFKQIIISVITQAKTVRNFEFAKRPMILLLEVKNTSGTTAKLS